MSLSSSRIAAVLPALVVRTPAAGVGAAELRVLSTVALRDAWHELQPRFEASGYKVVLVLGTSGGMAKRAAEG